MGLSHVFTVSEMPFEIMPLVREICRQARLNRMALPGVTRLVKLIYLADIEWRKHRNGEPLAELTWRFLHFGPYAIELAAPLGDPELDSSQIQSGKPIRRFTFTDEELIQQQVPKELSGLISALVKKWGDADLNMLLDYVYFETEPMENAKRGELLDFSYLRPVPHALVPKLDAGKLNAIRAKIRERTEAMALTRNGLHIPAVDAESQRAWDDDDRPVQLRPGVRVDFS